MKRLYTLLLFLLSIQMVVTAKDYHRDEMMYFKKTTSGNFQEVTERVKKSLQEQGFGVITEIDMDKKLNEKLNTEVKPYKILGVCNPGFAYKTLQIDDNIGVFLPCKVVIKQLENSKVEVVSVNPSMLMKMMNNESLSKIAEEVSQKLKKAIENL